MNKSIHLKLWLNETSMTIHTLVEVKNPEKLTHRKSWRSFNKQHQIIYLVNNIVEADEKTVAKSF